MDASLQTESTFNIKRARIVNSYAKRKAKSGGILYWMSRDQRVHDNWALYYAQQLSLKHSIPLIVCFCLVPRFLEATIRQYGFLLKGLQEVEKELKRLRIPFVLELGNPKARVPEFVKDHDLSVVVCDFSPLRVPLNWVHDTGVELNKLQVPLIQVDAHNIVPCWVTSNKAEYSARCIRGKVHNHLPEFLTDIPPISEHPPNKTFNFEDVDWSKADSSLEIDRTVKEVVWAEPGYRAGIKMLDDFCKKKLKNYSTQRNDPNKDSLSNLSPWYHFGHLSVQRAILEVKKYSRQHSKSVEAYIEEAVVRRELADNFCFYKKHYDSIEGASAWAQETLRTHSKDKREYIYSRDEFESGKTRDPLWNAAQLQMVNEGKMHGFMRMYWAKKILEWTPSPEEALKISIYLNDRYELDGRDPNGYVGCMWSVCGIHDQGWAERKVFGKIRYMNYAGCKRKFDVGQYERTHLRKRKKEASGSGASGSGASGSGTLDDYLGESSSKKKIKKE